MAPAVWATVRALAAGRKRSSGQRKQSTVPSAAAARSCQLCPASLQLEITAGSPAPGSSAPGKHSAKGAPSFSPSSPAWGVQSASLPSHTAKAGPPVRASIC